MKRYKLSRYIAVAPSLPLWSKSPCVPGSPTVLLQGPHATDRAQVLIQ